MTRLRLEGRLLRAHIQRDHYDLESLPGQTWMLFFKRPYDLYRLPQKLTVIRDALGNEAVATLDKESGEITIK